MAFTPTQTPAQIYGATNPDPAEIETHLTEIGTELDTKADDAAIATALAAKADDAATTAALAAKADDAATTTALAEKVAKSVLFGFSPSRDGTKYPWSVSDNDGKASFGVNEAGEPVFSDVVLEDSDDLRNSRESGNKNIFLTYIRDSDGKIIFGRRLDGTWYSGFNTSQIGESDFGVDYPVFSAANVDDYMTALRSERGMTYQIRKNDDQDVALIQDSRPMLFQPNYGQSNSGEAGAPVGGPLLTDPVFASTCVSFNGTQVHKGNTVVDTATLVGVAPVKDDGYANQTVGTLCAFATENAHREEDGTHSPGVFSYTSWLGGEAITTFERDGTLWDNLMEGVDRVAGVAAEFGRTVECDAINFLQGESGPVSYQAPFEALADDLVGELQTRLSLTAAPKLVCVQINTNDDATTDNGVALDQLAAARANANIVLAGPSYYATLVDHIHHTPEGRMMVGEVLAQAHKSIRDTGDFTPLWPTSITRSGTTVTVNFAVPADAIKIDDDFVKTVPNLGFGFTDSTDSATVTNATILSATQVELTLSNIPTGTDPKITYAIVSDTSIATDGWTTNRGLVYSPTRVPSLYYKLGYDVPSHVRHYATPFEMEIT